MNVATILKHKGRAVTTASPTLTLIEAAERLAERHIGALVVVDATGDLVGIISERDIIRALSEAGPECLGRTVAEHMTRQVVICQESDTLDELMALMTTRRFRHLPVVAEGDLIGIVSIGDVVKHHVAEIEMEATAMREYIANG
ncbi:MAG TPA: CBS domain-containing protein [Hyphomicrobiaceae bacterium]|nr:CBS domain-containing protein [Hyphomicrobiaceae bacterium]